MPSAALQEIVEYRGVCDLVAAKILTDNDTDGYTTGSVFAVAGVAEISKSTEQSNESHYYDNIPAIVISSMGADTISISASAIPLDVQAELTGQTYDSATGALIEEEATAPYFAIGYKTQDTSGHEMYVWRYKGKFTLGDQVNATKNAGTDANGQTLTYTGVSTTKKFSKTGRGAKAIVVDTSKELCSVTNFFSSVTTPDDLTGSTARTLTITQAAGTTVTVKHNGEALATGATIYDGWHLQISVTGGTVTVNSDNWFSGDIHVVSGNTTVVSTAAA